MNLTLTPIYFPVTLPIVAPVGDTAACTAVAETSLRESERRLRAFVSCTHRKQAGHPLRKIDKRAPPFPPNTQRATTRSGRNNPVLSEDPKYIGQRTFRRPPLSVKGDDSDNGEEYCSTEDLSTDSEGDDSEEENSDTSEDDEEPAT